MTGPQTPSTPFADPETSLYTDPGVVPADETDFASKPDAPLVEDALRYVAERDAGFGSSVTDELKAIRGEVESLSYRAGDTLSTNLVAAPEKTVRSARRLIDQHPIASLGLAALLGFAFGSTRRH
ncbi:hypothetical protein [Agrobacterium bohemicum]|uniref:DUF883 domain-containing protein n=1 Tax=Agrobacterium bohemicum TaxID=2052828 RepID=A0A135P8Q5_9HYPH|nr:hypothetical protein [Agrobacterium bohemicum]KXG87812.1 hypothetical protein ATO67_17470 [Agrobacterium bohemicum]